MLVNEGVIYERKKEVRDQVEKLCKYLAIPNTLGVLLKIRLSAIYYQSIHVFARLNCHPSPRPIH